MLRQLFLHILRRCHDCNRALVLAQEAGRNRSRFGIVPALDIYVLCCNSCVSHKCRCASALTCECGSCSDRTHRPVSRPDLCLCERIHCGIDLHIVLCIDRSHTAAVVSADDRSHIEKIISRGSDIHCFCKSFCQSAGIDSHDHISIHSLIIRSGKNAEVCHVDHHIFCVKLRNIHRADVSDSHCSADSVCHVPACLAGHCHVIY